MIIIQAAGGLGNQMQQYALYKKMEMLGKDVRLDVSWFEERGKFMELTLFPNVRFSTCSPEEKEWILGRSILQKALDKVAPGRSPVFRETAMYHKEIFDLDDRYLAGYWHCLAYTGEIAATLRNDFTFPAHPDAGREEVLRALISEMERTPSVSVHIRRGDYVNDPDNARLFSGIATEEYYKAAMMLFLKENPKTRFYYFTDDMDYVKKRYNDDESVTFVTGNGGKDAIQDMRLMARCHGNICANSTFSVWGGRLNVHPDAVRVRTLKMKNTQAVAREVMEGYWSGWKVIDDKGGTG